MNSDNSSKQILLSVLGVAILVVAVVGVSFAAFTFSQVGQRENKITTGTLTMTYTEGANGISITDMMPTTDETGKALPYESGQAFDFTIKAEMSKGANPIEYTITAKKDETSSLQDTDVKLYLEKIAQDGQSGAGTSVMEPKNFMALEASDKNGAPKGEMSLYTGNFSSSAIEVYRLRMWVAETYGSNDLTGTEFKTSKTFTVKVNVYAKSAAL